MLENNTEIINQRLMFHLFSHLKKTAFFNLFLAGFVVLYLEMDGYLFDKTVYWLGAMALVVFARFILSWLAENQSDKKMIFRYFLSLVVVLFLTGLIWGYAYAFFYPDISVFMRMLILLVIVGVSAASTVSMAGSPFCFYAFISPIILIILIQSAITGTRQSVSIVFVMATYVLFLKIIYDVNRSMLVNNIRLLLKQHDLINELRQFNEKLTLISTTDELTQLANRRHFSTRLLTDWKRAKRSNVPISVMVIDIDFFKEFNDNYGHLIGDECLRAVAEIISKQVQRGTDMVARYGGDEFAVILYDTNLASAEEVARKIVKALEKANLKHEYSPVENRITLSIGISSMKPTSDERYEAIILKADKALYKVKESGRNNIACDVSQGQIGPLLI